MCTSPDAYLAGVELLGAPPIEVAPKELELVAELGDHLLVVVQLGEQLEAVLPEIVRVVRQGVGVTRHRRYRCATGRKGSGGVENTRHLSASGAGSDEAPPETWATNRRRQVDAIEQQRELGGVDFQVRRGRARKVKHALLEALVPETEAR